MEYIVYLAMVLLIGTLVSALAYKLNLPNIFFLVFSGMIISFFEVNYFKEEVIITLSILGLILVVFNSASKLKLKEVKKYSISSLKLALVYLILNVLLLSSILILIFKVNFLIAVLFSTIVFGIDPTIALSISSKVKNKVTKLLEFEAILNTPLTIILSVFILKMLSGVSYSSFSDYVMPFLKQFGIGLAIGSIVGFLIVLIMEHYFFGDLSHLAIITSAIISYVVAELIGGNGVLSVTTFSIIFGNHHIKHKIELEKFASIFTHTIQILVFILVGTILIIDSTYIFMGSILFLIYLIIRLLSVHLSLSKLNFKEKLFMTLNVPKGVDVAILILLIKSIYSTIPNIELVINLSLLFTLFSIILSTLSVTFSPNLLKSK